MTKGYLVGKGTILNKDEFEKYFQALNEIGYAGSPLLKILQENGDTLLKPAESGLVETREEAEVLCTKLKPLFPQWGNWNIDEVEYPEAYGIYWARLS